MSATPIPASPENRLPLRAWLTLLAAAVLLALGVVVLAYRFTLPTDGWQVHEGAEVGLTYTRSLMGAPSGLRPGDRVIAVAGNRAVFEAVSPALSAAWRAGATLDYTVIRDGQELHLPVTLVRWQFGQWLLALLRAPFQLATQLATYFMLAVAAFAFLRRLESPAAGALFLMYVSLEATGLVTGTLPQALPEWIDPLAHLLTGFGNSILYGLVLPFVLIRFALVFPHPKPILRRAPWLPLVPLAVGLAINIFAYQGGASWLWLVLSLVLTVAIIIHNAFTMRDAVSRAQLLWGLGGVIFGFGLLTFLLLASTFQLIEFSEDVFDLGTAAATAVMGLTLAIAITRYRLFDIDIIIRRALVYSLLTALLALVYFGSVVLLQGLLRLVTGQSSSQLVTVLSTLAIAALFVPLRTRLQQAIDRRFYRRKYDVARTLAGFAAAARDEVELDRLSDHLVTVVAETMQPEAVSLWVKPATPSRPLPETDSVAA
jgi:hypothetical protein